MGDPHLLGHLHPAGRLIVYAYFFSHAIIHHHASEGVTQLIQTSGSLDARWLDLAWLVMDANGSYIKKAM